MTLSLQQLIPSLSRSLGIPAGLLLQSFRPATEADLPRILEFRRQIPDDVWWDDSAYVRWRYFDSWAGAGPAPYWVFEKDGEIIGGVGLEPVELIVDGEAHAAVRSMDIMVRPDFDGRGLAVLMSLVLFERFHITLVTGSNARSHSFASRMLEHVLELRVWKMLVRSRDFISRRVELGMLTGAAAAVGDSALALDRAWRRGRTSATLEVRELTEFDDQVTSISTAGDGSSSLAVRRSAAYLNWRFVRNPRCRYRIHGAFQNSVLAGYVVSALRPGRQDGASDGVIADWLAAPQVIGGVDPLPQLMRVAVDRLVDDGASLVQCLAYGARTAQLMEAAGFRARPGEGVPFFVRATDPSLHKRLASGEGWFLTGCDFDVE